ncbi:MAG: hypothetical protein ABI832_11680 [bacterium]
MTAMSQNHADFAARLARVQRNADSATQMLFVGVDEAYQMPRRERKARRSRGATLLHNILYPFSLVAAVALGTVSHGIGQVARYQVQGLPDLKANPDIEMLVQVILGISISMLLGYALRLHSKSFTTLKSTGVVIGVLFFHNAVHLYPQEFAAVTSEMWVNQLVHHTLPYSMLWRGISFIL